jgi:hypothetical protein
MYTVPPVPRVATAATGARVPPVEFMAWATPAEDAASVAESNRAVVACAAAFLACLML